MSRFPEWIASIGILKADAGGPWGGRGGGDGGEGGGSGGGGGPRNPWNQPPDGGRPRGGGGRRGPTQLDELIRRMRAGGGGGGRGGLPPAFNPARIWRYVLALFVVIWLLFTSIHRIGPQERGVVSLFGRYWYTLNPGVSFTPPAPIVTVRKIDVEEIRTVDIGTTAAQQENLMLTGDQNVIDLAYSVRWNISNPVLYMFQLKDPDETISEAAESAMREVIADVSLNDAIGSGRNAIEARVQQRTQELLNDYRAGVRIQGVAVKQADPPAAVNDAFKEVSAAQQTAQTYLNEARAYAQQLSAKAQGEAAAFDQVYSEYKLAPEVTRRRMYYETMERVLSKVDKTIVEVPGVTPYLPLPEVARRPAPAPAPEAQR
ncbi:FtsH protease activity modulator HflK [Sphingomonas sanxanigenens]|uniref:Protein HflK n=1 Tax=Sphingomonas sanxanigenens DSM 19645 = NX02 TaxID=1123269 RepID=W0ANQ9_9SPHN|nr:FtsH protease activity modulator HflK [Sphingomonas sanxanigenens]AHE57370.1 hypothetical protein NX02_29005 [Sphingomonas sanxanigenens DSM 19645 = NX02]